MYGINYSYIYALYIVDTLSYCLHICREISIYIHITCLRCCIYLCLGVLHVFHLPSMELKKVHEELCTQSSKYILSLSLRNFVSNIKHLPLSFSWCFSGRNNVTWERAIYIYVIRTNFLSSDKIYFRVFGVGPPN